MLTNSKIKYPSFRIDDILNNNFKSNQTNDYDKFDQPINLSSFKFDKIDEFNKNIKSISSISSSSPTLSVGSDNLTDSPNFQTNHQFTSPIIDQLIKYNDNLQNIKLTNEFCQQSFNQYTSIEDFYLKLNKNNLENYEKQTDDDLLNDNLNNAITKLHQDYQTQLTKNTLLNELPFYQQLQNEQFNLSSQNSQNIISQPLNQPNSSFYMQQFYIRMKMLMNAKPRKGGQIRFNHSQTNELEQMFTMKKYLIPSERKQIAKKLSLSERQVKTWFQNRRAKQRRSSNYRV